MAVLWFYHVLSNHWKTVTHAPDLLKSRRACGTRTTKREARPSRDHPACGAGRDRRSGVRWSEEHLGETLLEHADLGGNKTCRPEIVFFFVL